MSLRPKPARAGSPGEERIDYVNRVGAANAILRTKAQSGSNLSASLSEASIRSEEDLTPADQVLDFGANFKGKHAVVLPPPDQNIVTPDFLMNVLMVFKSSPPEMRSMFRYNSRLTLSHTEPDGEIDLGEAVLLLSEALMKLVDLKERSCLPSLFEQIVAYCSNYEPQYAELAGVVASAKSMSVYFSVEPQKIPSPKVPLFHGLGMIPYPRDIDVYYTFRGLSAEFSAYVKAGSKLSAYEKKDAVDHEKLMFTIVRNIRGAAASDMSNLYDTYVAAETIIHLFGLVSQIASKIPAKLINASVDNYKKDLDIRASSSEAKGFEADLGRIKMGYSKVVTEAIFQVGR